MSLFAHSSVASKSLRAMALLLGYPDAQLRRDLAAVADALHGERALTPARLTELDALIAAIDGAEPLDAEAAYVDLFDRGRSTSLHLFEHVHGDSRERGPAMIDLAHTYEKAGLLLAEGELPDFLPVVLEFASTQPPREARALLAEIAHLCNGICVALQQRGSPYAGVLGAILELAGEKVTPVKVAVDAPIDSVWEEPIVFDGCSSKGQAGPDQPQPIQFVRRDLPDRGVRT
jgi:nitrate reductase molybdenum cofactor assembly chaperone NarJ/NarW